MSALILLAVLHWRVPCFTVDQRDGAVALVRFEDGSVDELGTPEREGSSVCIGQVTRRRPRARPLPPTLPAGDTPLAALAE